MTATDIYPDQKNDQARQDRSDGDRSVKERWTEHCRRRFANKGTYRYRLPWLRSLSQDQLVTTRRVGMAIWVVAICGIGVLAGWSEVGSFLIPLLFAGFAIYSLGHSRLAYILVDWGPFILFLLAYRGIKTVVGWMGIPVQWHLAPDVDRWLFGGTLPNVWLQEHWRYEHAPWWEFILMAVYSSYFFMPYTVAFIEWLRSRVEFRRYIVGLLAVSSIGLGIYVFVPAAPPWAAARCTPADVADQPSHTPCMFSAEHAGEGSILGPVNNKNDSPEPWVERLTSHAWSQIAPFGLAEGVKDFQDGARREERADGPTLGPVEPVPVGEGPLAKAQASSNLVSAIPSLHAGITMYFATFLFSRRRWKWGAVAFIYALTMGFALVFFAEHYVFDIILGWTLAAAVPLIQTWWMSRRRESINK